MKKLTIFAITASLALVVSIPVDPTNFILSHIHPFHGQPNTTVSQEHHTPSSQVPNISSLQDNKEKDNIGKKEEHPNASNVHMIAGEKQNGTIHHELHVQPPKTTNHSTMRDNKAKDNIGKIEKPPKASNVHMTAGENSNSTIYHELHVQPPNTTNHSTMQDNKEKDNIVKIEEQPKASNVHMTAGGNSNSTIHHDLHVQPPQTTNHTAIQDNKEKDNIGKKEEQSRIEEPTKAIVKITVGENGLQKLTSNQDHNVSMHQTINVNSVNTINNLDKSQHEANANLDHHGQLPRTSNITLNHENNQDATHSQDRQGKQSTINKQTDNNGKMDEQDKDGKEDSIATFRKIWNQMSPESRKNCVEKYLKDEKNDAEYQKMTQAEREAEWNKKTEEEKACVFHMYEERRKEAPENPSDEQKNHKIKNDARSSNTTKSSNEVKKEHRLIIKKEEESDLRQFWFTMSRDQKTNCYEMYDRDEHPTKSETVAWRSLTKVERVAEIKAIWHTLSMETKACAVHIRDEGIRAEEEKRNTLSGNFYDKTKYTNSENMKKDVYGVVSKEEANRLRHLWFTFDVDFKTKCYEMYQENEHPAKSETDEWNNMDQNERKEEIVEIWQTLPDNMKACAIHIRDEEATLEYLDRRKNKNGEKKSVYSLVTEEDAKRLRQVWFTLDLYHYQKILKEYKKCYEMYTYDEHPTKKEATHWKNLSQEKRREEILQIWPTLPDNIKACALHIADEEAKFSKKEYMKKHEKNAISEQKKVVHGVVTEVEANRLRHLWIDLSLAKKRQCYELYKKNEHPSKADATIWKSMNPKERREEIFKEWHNLSDNLKACAIHIADYEAKLEKEKNNKTPEPKEITTNDQRINNNKGIKNTVNSHLENKDEGKPLNSKPHHQIQNSNKNEDSPSQKPNNANSNQPLHQSVHTSPILQGNQMKNNSPTKKEEEASLINVRQLGQF